MSAALMAACNSVLLTKVVARSAPFQRTTEEARNSLPLTLTVKAGSPTVALEGDKDARLARRLYMLKVMEFDVPATGLNTVTSAVPAVAMLAALMAACNSVLLTKVVTRSLPFQRTTEEETKPLPLTVRVKAGSPARALEGAKEVMVGTGLLMVKGAALEVPPPGAGLNTVT